MMWTSGDEASGCERYRCTVRDALRGRCQRREGSRTVAESVVIV